MGINFDALPNERPSSGFPLIPTGYCIAEVESAEMKISTGEKTAGQQYLQVIFKCTSLDGTVQAKIWDNFFDSDKSLLRYKLRQFLIAIGCKLQGEFTLKDLTKIIIGKKCIAAVKVEEKTNYSSRNVIDSFEDKIFYPMSELSNFVEIPKEPASYSPTPTFNAADGEDKPPFNTGDAEY